jgi:hypothetical protein
MMPAPSPPFGCLLIALLARAALGPAPTNAQNWPALLTLSAASGDEISFAFPGKTCPGGSELYKRPEQARARASGRVCCGLVGKAHIISEKMSKCPVGVKAYTRGGRPDSDVMWWENDLRSSSLSDSEKPRNYLTILARIVTYRCVFLVRDEIIFRFVHSLFLSPTGC